MLYQIADEFYPMLAEKDLTLSTELEENLTLYADADKLARVRTTCCATRSTTAIPPPTSG